MGTYCSYTGLGIINDDKKEKFAQAVSKILYYGGMMNVQAENVLGIEVHLLSPVKIEKGQDVDFGYNYFEDDFWEEAGYKYDEGVFYSNKIGWAEFNDVVKTVYCLYELFDDGVGYVEEDDEIVDSSFYIGWINSLLGKEYSIDKRFRLWDYAEKISIDKAEYGEQFEEYDLKDLIPNSKWQYIGGTEYADLLYISRGTESFIEEAGVPRSYSEDIFRCRNIVEELLNKEGQDKGYQMVLSLLKKNAKERRKVKEGSMADLAEESLILPARVLLYLSTELTGQDFWQEWLSNRDSFYHDEELKQYESKEILKLREVGRKTPIGPISTSRALRQALWSFSITPEFLEGEPDYYLSDADRLFWWDGSEEVIIDEDTQKWLSAMGKMIRDEIATLPDENDAQDFTERFIDLLNDIEERYTYVFAFRDMFYEFIENSENKYYQAAVVLLHKLYEEYKQYGKIIELERWTSCSKTARCNRGRMTIKRYLSLLANKKLRYMYLGF